MESNSMFSLLGISASGMNVQRRLMDVVAGNIANSKTLKGPDGKPYQRKVAVIRGNQQFNADLEKAIMRRLDLARTNGRHIDSTSWRPGKQRRTQPVMVEDVRSVENGSWNLVFDPSHPEADDNGYVAFPNINILTEMVEMIAANRAYQANLSAFNSAKELFKMSLNI